MSSYQTARRESSDEKESWITPDILTDGEVEEITVVDATAAEKLQPALYAWALLLTCATLAFGSVHATPLALSALLVLSITAWVVVRFPASLAAPFIYRPDSQSSLPMATLLLLTAGTMLVYVILQNLWLSLDQLPHPVIDSYTLAPSWSAVLQSASQFLVYLAGFAVVSALLHRSVPNLIKLGNALMALGTLISVIAIAHWFYDNGRLFWLFEPDSEFNLPRARWPFVNPNHLGSFLLPLFFLTISECLSSSKEFLRKLARETVGQLPRALRLRSTQREMRTVLLLSVACLAQGLAIAASLSRGAWLGAVVGLAILVLGSRMAILRPFEDLAQNGGSRRQRGSTSRQDIKQRRLGRLVPRFLPTLTRLILPVACFAILVFFLNSYGRELVKGRMHYALEHSLDDVRVTLYRDSMAMLKDRPLFGFGVGTWAANYPRYMSPQLAGLNPVYLHSEPLQLWIEMGTVGFALVSATIALLFIKCLLALVRCRDRRLVRQCQRLLGLTAGLAAFATAVCFEFPLRVPAVALMLATILALTCSILGALQRESS